MDWPGANAKNHRSVVNKPSSGRTPTPAPIAAHHQTGTPYSPINNRRPSIRGPHSIVPLHPAPNRVAPTTRTALPPPRAAQRSRTAQHSTVLMWSRGTTRNDCTPHWATGHHRTWRTSTIDNKRHKPSHSRDGTKRVFASLCGGVLGLGVFAGAFSCVGYERGVLLYGLFPPRK